MLQANVAEKILRSLGSVGGSQSSIFPTFAITTAITTKIINGHSISLQVLTGNVWIDLKGGVVTAANGYKVTAGSVIESYVEGNVTLISDVTGGTAQILIWGV
jgi:hypothetical protein